MNSQGQHTNEECWYRDVCELDIKCSSCIKFDEMQYLMENSNLPKAKQKVLRLTTPRCDEDAYKRLSEIKDDIYNFVYDGRSLYIGSTNTGNGKTTWAIKMMHQYFNEIWHGNGFEPRALFIHVPTFMVRFKDFKLVDEKFEALKKLLYTVDLVVWDDIAGLNMSAYDYSVILSYIDYRCLSELSNIYTSNIETREELVNSVGLKLTSRILTSDTEMIIFKNGDVR